MLTAAVTTDIHKSEPVKTILNLPVILLTYLCVSTLLLLSNTTSASEEKPLVTPSAMAMGIKHYTINEARISNTGPQVAMQGSNIKLPIGKYEGLGQIFVPQVAIEQTTFKFPNPSFNEKSMYSIKLPMLFIEKYNDNWTRILNITPSWHTDLEAKDEESYSLMGLILWRYTDDTPHSYTIGAGINRLFGEYKPIPMVSYSYQTDRMTRYDLGFPVTKIEHRANQDWSFFSAITPSGGNWRYELDEKQRVNLSYSSWVATLGIRRNLVDKFWLTLEAGKTFEREIDLNNDNSASQKLNIADANVMILSLGLHP